jgi:hypothetical protein
MSGLTFDKNFPQPQPCDLQWPNRLGVVKFGLGAAITSAAAVFLIGMTATLIGWGVPVVQLLSIFLVDYAPSISGSIVGALGAFADGFMAGVLMAGFYNRIAVQPLA